MSLSISTTLLPRFPPTARVLDLPQPGDVLHMQYQGVHADGSVRLQGLNWQLCLATWPSTWPPQEVGAWLVLRLLTLTPVEFAWLGPLQPAPTHRPPAVEGGVVSAWLPEQATLLRLRSSFAAPCQLPRQEALGTVVRQENAGVRVVAQPATNALSIPVPGMPLWLPFWLWGGFARPVWWQTVEQYDPLILPDALALVLHLELPHWGLLHLWVRRTREGVSLLIVVDAALCQALRAQYAALALAMARVGVRLCGCRIQPAVAQTPRRPSRQQAVLAQRGDPCASDVRWTAAAEVLAYLLTNLPPMPRSL